MRRSILLLALSAAVLGGCTSAYKTGQTPDDVYYSPERQHDEYVTMKDNDDRRYQGDDYYDDRYLRMKVHNRVMWSDLDDYYFYNPRYSYSYYNSWNWSNPWSPYTYWNYYYNPYCSRPVIYSTGYAKATYNHPRMFNLNTYNNTQLTNNNYTNPKASFYNNSYNNTDSRPLRIIGTNSNSNRNYNPSSNAGNFLRNIFNGSNSSSSNNNSSPSSSTRSSSSNNNSSSNSSSSSGGSAPVRRF